MSFPIPFSVSCRLCLHRYSDRVSIIRISYFLLKQKGQKHSSVPKCENSEVRPAPRPSPDGRFPIFRAICGEVVSSPFWDWNGSAEGVLAEGSAGMCGHAAALSYTGRKNRPRGLLCRSPGSPSALSPRRYLATESKGFSLAVDALLPTPNSHRPAVSAFTMLTLYPHAGEPLPHSMGQRLEGQFHLRVPGDTKPVDLAGRVWGGMAACLEEGRWGQYSLTPP